VPPSVKDELNFIFCERVEDVMREALGLDLSAQFKVAGQPAR
jgi:hypothetical protein